jgi:hypothetical protein
MICASVRGRPNLTARLGRSRRAWLPRNTSKVDVVRVRPRRSARPPRSSFSSPCCGPQARIASEPPYMTPTFRRSRISAFALNADSLADMQVVKVFAAKCERHPRRLRRKGWL